jgi:acyl-CoA synthetase (AMP-forming)/AMP-acid ligase II
VSLDFQLSRMHPGSRPPTSLVAERGGHLIRWETFVADVGRLSAELETRGGGDWLLFAEDCYAFGVGLFAIWQAGGTAVVPPNDQPGTLSELGHGLQGLVTDRSFENPGLRTLHPLAGTGVSDWTWRPFTDGVPRLVLCTSGTTGPRKGVAKTVAQLSEEVDQLEESWGHRLAGRLVFASVSQHHLYGLLFRLFWPLSAGRPFVAETYLNADELVPRLRKAGSAVLVSSPAHLRRLRHAPDLRLLGASCQPVFSSGGPLDEVTAEGLIEAMGEAPLEVFGSTETGGVAWRQQWRGPTRLVWTPFPKVQVTVQPDDGLLVVQSPLVSGAVPGDPFTMGDRAELLPDGRFRLLGRADRIVKVGEERVSLPEMEAKLREHSAVAEAALALVARGPEARIAAAVVLSIAGHEALARSGRAAMGTTLRRHLALHFSETLLPRVWRYVDHLPEDALGKISAAALGALFRARCESATESIPVLDEWRDDHVVERLMRVPFDYPVLAGHFPGLPVVPGVIQLYWVMELARGLGGPAMTLGSLEVVKFKGLLRPGQTFRLRVELSDSDETVRFRLRDDQTMFSSGRGRLVVSKVSAD